MEGALTLSVHWHVQVSNLTVGAKYFSKVISSDILRELLDDDLDKVSFRSSEDR